MKILKKNKLIIVYVLLLIISTYLYNHIVFDSVERSFSGFLGIGSVLMMPSFLFGIITLFINQNKIPLVICLVQVCVILYILLNFNT